MLQNLGYLDRIEGSPLADLVAREPERATMVVGQVLADASHEDVILARRLQGHGIDIVLGIIDEGHARSLLEGVADLLYRERALGFEPDALGMAAE